MSWLKNIFGDSGCTNHHYDGGRGNDDYRIKWDSPYYVVQRKMTQQCQHEGCLKTRTKYVTQREYSIEKDDSGEFYDDGMEKFNDILKWLRNHQND